MGTIARRDPRPFFAEVARNAGMDSLAGLWIFVSAFLFRADYWFLANNLIAGGIVAIIGFFGPFANPRFPWIPAAIGAWVAISPFVLGFNEHAGATWNNVIAGIVLALLALRTWSVTKHMPAPGAADSRR